MTLLLKNSLPAERARGCCFAENFDSVEAFYKNGGTITAGTPVFGKNNCYFDGSTNITYNSNSTIHLAAPSSAMCWVKPTVKGTTYRIALIVGVPVSLGGLWFGVYGLSGYFAGSIWAGTDVGSTTSPDLVSWYHLAYTYSGSGATFRLYVNGSLVAGPSSTGVTQTITSSAISIGNQGSGYPYTGYVSQVRVFDKELSAEEVAAYANNTMWSII